MTNTICKMNDMIIEQETVLVTDSDRDDAPDHETGVMTREKPKVKRPSMFKVILLNDDYTPQEFVVWLLEAVFNKSSEEAVRVMLHVHQTGVGICGIYTFEVAETKVAQVMEFARREGHPLQCVMEKE